MKAVAGGDRPAAHGRAVKAVAGHDQKDAHGRGVTITIPDRPLEAVMLPVAAARRVLTGRNTGLPVYVGLGVLAVADVIDPPLAAVTGLGYLVLRRWGPLRPKGEAPDGAKTRSSRGNGEKS